MTGSSASEVQKQDTVAIFLFTCTSVPHAPRGNLLRILISSQNGLYDTGLMVYSIWQSHRDYEDGLPGSLRKI